MTGEQRCDIFDQCIWKILKLKQQFVLMGADWKPVVWKIIAVFSSSLEAACPIINSES